MSAKGLHGEKLLRIHELRCPRTFRSMGSWVHFGRFFDVSEGFTWRQTSSDPRATLSAYFPLHGPLGLTRRCPASGCSIRLWIRRVSVRVSLICSINPYNCPYHPFPGSTGGDPPSPGGLGIHVARGSLVLFYESKIRLKIRMPKKRQNGPKGGSKWTPKSPKIVKKWIRKGFRFRFRFLIYFWYSLGEA